MVGDGIRFVYMGFDSYKKGRLLVGLIFFCFNYGFSQALWGLTINLALL
jgi:hypothetical protein